MGAGAGHLAHREQSGQAGAAPDVGENTAHPVVRRRRDRDRLDGPVQAGSAAGSGDGRETSLEQFAAETGGIQTHRYAALPCHLPCDASGHDVTGREFRVGVHVKHEPVSGRIPQHSAFPAHGLGDQRGPGHRERGRVELVELEVGHGRPGPPRGGHAVARCEGRVRGVREEHAGTAGREDHRVGINRAQLAVGSEEHGAGHPAVVPAQVDQHRVLLDAQAGARVFERPSGARTHRRHQGGFDGGARGIPAGMQHSGPRVGGLETAGQPGLVSVEVHAEADQVSHPGRSLGAEHVHRDRVAQPGPGAQSVQRVGLDRVVWKHGRGDPTLGPAGVAVGQCSLRDEGDLMTGIRRPYRGDESGQPTADHEHTGHGQAPTETGGFAASIRSRAMRALPATSSGTWMRFCTSGARSAVPTSASRTQAR